MEVDATLKNASVAAIRENCNKEYLHCLHQTVVNYQLFCIPSAGVRNTENCKAIPPIIFGIDCFRSIFT